MRRGIKKRIAAWVLAMLIIVTASVSSVSLATNPSKPDIASIRYRVSANEIKNLNIDEKNIRWEDSSWKLDLGEGFYRNQVMVVHFRDKISLKDASLIQITGDGETYNFKMTRSPQSVRVIDERLLVLDFNHLYRYGKQAKEESFVLRKDTAYRLTIPENTLAWKENTLLPIRKYLISFTTREAQDTFLEPIWISSISSEIRPDDLIQDPLSDYPHHDYDVDYTASKIIQGTVKGNKSDNLTRFQLWRENANGHFVKDENRTRWDVEESEKNHRLFIHFNQEIRLNDGAVDHQGIEKKYTSEDLTKAFELYETPYKFEVFPEDVYRYAPEDPNERSEIKKEKASRKKWTGKEYRTTGIKKPYPSVWDKHENNVMVLNPEQKVKIKSVEIVKEKGTETNRLMIVSEEPLLSHNRYLLKIRKDKVLADSKRTVDNLTASGDEYYRDILISKNGQTILPKGFEFEVWTKEAKSNPASPVVKIETEGYDAGTFIEGKNFAKELEQSDFIIHGAPRYDRDNTPIVLKFDREVILNPNSTHKFSGIRIIEGDHFQEFEQHEIPIRMIRIENDMQNGKVRSKVKINPESTLKPGTPYTLIVDRDVFVSRAHEFVEYDWRNEKDGNPTWQEPSPKKKLRLNPPTKRFRSPSDEEPRTAGDNIRKYLDEHPLMFEFVVDGETTSEHGSVVTGVILHGAEKLKANDLKEKSLYSMHSLKEFKDRKRTHKVNDVDGGSESYTEYVKFEIHGQNFNERIKDIVFTNRRTGHQITIKREKLKVWDNKPQEKSSIHFENVELLTGYIPESALSEMTVFPRDNTESALIEESDPKSSQGVYEVAIHFESGTAVYTKDAPRLTLVDRPVVIASTPAFGARYIDADRLTKPGTREAKEYYVEVRFEDLAGSFLLSDAAMKGIKLNEKGKKEVLNDSSKPVILEKGKDGLTNVARVFIPLKGRLDEGKEFEWTISPSSLASYQLESKSGKKFGNHGYKSYFTTNIVPLATRQYEGSVPEEYDPTYPILIEGEKGFIEYNALTKVYFMDASGRGWDPDRIEIIQEKGKQQLLIYLPGARKLPVGTYDIVISNGENYRQELKQAVFSVVKRTGEVPNEITKLKLITKEISVIAERQSSMDHISLKEDRIVHEIDMDGLTGKMPRTVKVTAPIGTNLLKLNSSYGNMVLEGIQPFFPTEKQLAFEYGRPEPAKVSELRKELRGKGVRSAFVRLSDLNFSFKKGRLVLKYNGISSENLTVMRYDRDRFSFVPVDSQVDELNRTISADITQPGIYVAVQMK